MAKIYNFPTKHKEEIIEDQQLDIADATHWVCDAVPEHFKNCLTLGKAYELIHDEVRDEYYLYDDQCFNTVHYLTSPGRFVVMDNKRIL